MRIIEQITALPWAILPDKLVEIRAAMAGVAPEEQARTGAPVQFSGGKAVAVLPIYGPIVPRGGFMASFFGAVGVDHIRNKFRAAMDDPDIAHIILDIDSPGGQVGGVKELAAEIYRARGVKPVTAVANGLAASAAYWIGSAAETFVATPSGDIGSIGVFAVHQDICQALEQDGVKVTLISAGKYKTEGNPFEPLQEEALEAAQKRVDEFYNMFTSDVAKGRNVSQDDVMAGFGQGRLVGAEEALQAGMIDQIATIDEVLNGLTAKTGGMRADDTDYRMRRLRAISR